MISNGYEPPTSLGWTSSHGAFLLPKADASKLRLARRPVIVGRTKEEATWPMLEGWQGISSLPTIVKYPKDGTPKWADRNPQPPTVEVPVQVPGPFSCPRPVGSWSQWAQSMRNLTGALGFIFGKSQKSAAVSMISLIPRTTNLVGPF